MKRNLYILLVILIMMLGFTGCHSADQPTINQTQTPSSPIDSETPSAPINSETPLIPAPSEFVESTLGSLHIADVTDELLSKYDSFHEYINNEDGASLVIWTDKAIKDFAFIAVDFDVTGDELSFIAGETLFSIDELSPEKPFVLKLLFPGAIPSYGISFVDENGVERHYTINLSGQGADEAPPYFLQEFENMF